MPVACLTMTVSAMSCTLPAFQRTRPILSRGTMPMPSNVLTCGPAPYPAYGQNGPDPAGQPATVHAATVLDLVAAALVVLAAFLCFAFASADDALYDLSHHDVANYAASVPVLRKTSWGTIIPCP